MSDSFHIVGFTPHNAKKVEKAALKKKNARLLGLGRRSATPGAASALKHRNVNQLLVSDIRELGEDDMEIVYDMEDEMGRCASTSFNRIYPTAKMASYDKYFECLRYNNTIVQLWLSAQRHAQRGKAKARRYVPLGPLGPFGSRCFGGFLLPSLGGHISCSSDSQQPCWKPSSFETCFQFYCMESNGIT